MQVHVQVLDATQVDQRRRQEAAQADVQDQAALDNLDNLAGDGLASLELLLNADPGALVLGTLLGQDQTAVLVLLLQDQSLDLVAEIDDLGRIGVLADGQLADGHNALGLESDVHQHLVMLDLDNRAVDQVAPRRTRVSVPSIIWFI